MLVLHSLLSELKEEFTSSRKSDERVASLVLFVAVKVKDIAEPESTA